MGPGRAKKPHQHLGTHHGGERTRRLYQSGWTHYLPKLERTRRTRRSRGRGLSASEDDGYSSRGESLPWLTDGINHIPHQHWLTDGSTAGNGARKSGHPRLWDSRESHKGNQCQLARQNGGRVGLRPAACLSEFCAVRRDSPQCAIAVKKASGASMPRDSAAGPSNWEESGTTYRSCVPLRRAPPTGQTPSKVELPELSKRPKEPMEKGGSAATRVTAAQHGQYQL